MIRYLLFKKIAPATNEQLWAACIHRVGRSPWSDAQIYWHAQSRGSAHLILNVPSCLSNSQMPSLTKYARQRGLPLSLHASHKYKTLCCRICKYG